MEQNLFICLTISIHLIHQKSKHATVSCTEKRYYYTLPEDKTESN